jgi:hypothetical protein
MSVVMLSIVYAECNICFWDMLSVVVLNVVEPLVVVTYTQNRAR